MSRKRRVFDIDLPDDDLPQAAPETKSAAGSKRGPMASAISENAVALKARKDAADAIRQENDALAHEYVQARAAGQVIQHIRTVEIYAEKLVRDRIPADDEEMADLITSIQEVGLSNPIQVEERAEGGGYELIQGYRRLTAYRTLGMETGDEQWKSIPAFVRPVGEAVGGLYRRMVDENIVRKDLSFAEMAAAAQNYAADPETDVETADDAVPLLFKSASYTKRSYIRSFARLLDHLGPWARFPTQISRKLGLDLLKRIEADHDVAVGVVAALKAQSNPSEEDELALLRSFAEEEPRKSVVAPKSRAGTSDPSKSKTTFDIRTEAGRVKCTAGVGRLEIRTNQDFSAIDRARLEQAIASLVDGLK